MSEALAAACAAVAAAFTPEQRRRRWLEAQCKKLAELVQGGRLDLATKMLHGLLAARSRRGRRAATSTTGEAT